MGDAAEDLWHVRMGPTEVKKLTLEQLDDLFRLDVISADTQVWQPGMDEWLPLSVVAGLGDEEPETVSIPVSAPPPTTLPRTTSTAWPPVPQAAAAQSSWPPPVSRPPPAVSTRPPPPSARSNPPPYPRSNPPLSDAMSSWPPAAAWSDPPRPVISPFADTAAAYASVASPRLDDTAPRARGVGGSGAWVIVLSVIVGLTITLYRNAVVHAAAGSIGQGASYLKLEAALGGPGFGTPRAVETMTVRAPAPEADTVSPSPVTPRPTATAEAAPAPEPKPAATAPATPKVAAPAVETPRSAPVAAPRGGGSPSPDPDKVFKPVKKGKKGGASDYDPLNPNL